MWMGTLYALQERLIFPRDMTGSVVPDKKIPPAVERIWIASSESAEGSGGGVERVEGWFFRAHRGDAAPAPAVIFAHGNAELIDHNVETAEWYLERGISVLLPEYRGYGRSGGHPSQDGIQQDMIAFHAWLTARPDIDSARIVYHGRSLGTGIVAQLARVHTPAALILESPFASIASIARGYCVPAALLKHPYRTDKVLPMLTCPILILHSSDDEIIGIDHGRRLHKLAPGSTLVEMTGSHNTWMGTKDEYWEAIEEVLRESGVTR